MKLKGKHIVNDRGVVQATFPTEKQAEIFFNNFVKKVENDRQRVL